MRKDFLDLLNNIKKEDNPIKYERYLVIDSLNLFFRNFSAINTVNSRGIHVGGLGGFLRSLGFLIKNINPTQVYLIFDGVNSSRNRKNLISEYKSNRNINRITKHELFDNLEEENESKIDQITRLIQYLKILPVKTTSLYGVEADDIIAYLSKILPKHNDDKIFIVSNDRDYIQLINNNTILFRPSEKEYYTPKTVKEKFDICPENFILYKLLMGDNSDKISGVKGLGPKSIFKHFPELKDKQLSLDGLLNIAEKKIGDNIVYARLLHDVNELKNKYKVMDLSNPIMSDKDKNDILELIESESPKLQPDIFVKMSQEDQIGSIITNVDFWVRDVFKEL
jgi:DNA polymerase-1